MHIKTILLSIAIIVMGAAVTMAHDEKMDNDPISGEWDVSFFVQGTTTPATFVLKLDGNKVTGSVNSAHTGPGTLRGGSWVENKLSFTVDFAKHESIAITGHLDHDKLTGEFTTEGFTAKWEAKKKTSAPAAAMTHSVSNGDLNGEWAAAFTAEGTNVPVTLNFHVDGDKISGSTDSPHLGPGKISNGQLTSTGLSFNIESAIGTINITGAVKDGKLVGEFVVGPRKGTFEATKKQN